ncbi:hypothetical protein [Desulfosporosinus nitroreducens]|uniref:Uncharacterized protein n=1 Tax=Desulfosporosinus nitroreducens TaxID=2018668 RepID=A0ABT8QZC4_9FIRM|nr:hypothetical protein [Desulfosporosinus nitroreducens]MDO0825408.1 hypothetical protein [Desulfosporosinus nitroreducens]
MITEGEIWLVNSPFEENPNQFLPRPVIVLNVDLPQILSTKVTRHDPRATDRYDTPIQYWKKQISSIHQQQEYQRQFL